jgi:hypothetical protein
VRLLFREGRPLPCRDTDITDALQRPALDNLLSD